MTDASSQSIVIGEFEHVAVGSSVVLLRVSGRSSRPRPAPEWRPALLADHGSGPERYAALPSPPDAEGVVRAAYSVPATLVGGGTRFRLELENGEICELPPPTPGAARRPAPEGERAETGGDQADTLSEARDRATRLQSENATLTATLEELEIWRGELERRLADTTTELADTKARLARAQADAALEALVARAEADALEQAARELIDAAQQGR